MTRLLPLAAALLAALATPAAAQMNRLSVDPYVGYGFYGSLPETSARLEGGPAYGARAALRLTRQWGVYGNFQRSRPKVTGQLPFGGTTHGDRTDVDHWSAGVAFSYLPRGGADGVLPVTLEAGYAQVRYTDGPSDPALNLGISSASRLGRNVALRYGLNDYVSRFDGDRGTIHQPFARVGVELSI